MMLHWLNRKLRASIPLTEAAFADSESQQSMRFVRAILIPGIAALCVEIIFDRAWPAPHTLAADCIMVGLLIAAWGALVALRRGHATAAGAATVLLTWLGGGAMMWFCQGVRDSVILMQVLAILVAGLLGWPVLAAGLTIATIAHSVVLGYAEHRAIITVAPDHTLNVARDLSVMVLVVGIVILMYARGMRSARERMMLELRRQQQNEQERKQLLEWEREARAQAEQANLSKDRFIATLSHELRTPLTPVLMSLSVMEGDQDLSPAARQDARVMRQNIQIEMRLIDDLLDLSRATFGKLRLDRRPCCVSEVVEDVIRICRPDLEERGIRLVRQFAKGRVQMSGDADRLRQVFWNLLRNATKFTPEGGTIRVNTHVVTAHGSSVFRVQVADSGPGIDAELMPRLFNLFEQGKASQSSGGGLGVGLAISRTIVQEHGGTITAANNTPRAGAVFTVELPCGLEYAEQIPVAPEPAADQPLRALDIPFVEDDRVTGAVFSRCLGAMGHRVTKAVSLAAAREAIAGKERYDLLISDIGLPDGSGLELMPLFAQQCGGPGISLSGFGAEQDIAASQAAGFAIHMIKPVSFEQLKSAIAAVAPADEAADDQTAAAGKAV